MEEEKEDDDGPLTPAKSSSLRMTCSDLLGFHMISPSFF